ncbi:hypothetical protein LOTGIDRAFT_229278 [Lottia gigantea]|uniref:RRM domain-containing protein n=1 Tax=Lottia gigantea TaxID=225164 RepID=V3ZWW6_LOTGI|nr:hypothetical protein LOTGIDRAFT_229278 [Lottia gigantea]ESO87120.1 hypothetical protein LOTGIDRAFT_229278 [Lottia gigantea]
MDVKCLIQTAQLPDVTNGLNGEYYHCVTDEVAITKKKKEVKQASSDEESEESMDEAEEVPEPVKTKKTKAVKNGKSKKAAPPPESSDDDEEEEEEEEEEKPAKTKKSKKATKEESDDDDDDEEENGDKDDDDDDDEEEEEKPKAQKRKNDDEEEAPAKKSKSESDPVSLFVGGLDFETTPDTIKKFFSDNGVELSDVRKREGKRFGHIDLEDSDDLDKAMQLHGSEIDGCEIRIDKAEKNNSGGGERRSFGAPAKNKTLTARNLSYDTTEDSLKDAFEGAISARIPTFPDSGKSRGRGFIDFDSVEAAEEAMKNMNEQQLDGRTVYVEFAHERGSSGGGGGFRGGRDGFRGGRGGGGFRGRGGGGRGGGFRGGRGGRGGGGFGGRGGGFGSGGQNRRKTFDD